MAINQEELIKLLAEQQARLDRLEQDNLRLSTGLVSMSLSLEQEKNLRITSEARSAELEVLKKKEQEQLQKEKLFQMQQQQELERKWQREAYIATLNALDSTGASQLHHACWAKDIPTINRLIREGANVNVKSHTGHTCLDIARTTNNWKIVLLLCAYGGKGDKSHPLVCEKPTHLHPLYDKMKNTQKEELAKERQRHKTLVAQMLKM